MVAWALALGSILHIDTLGTGIDIVFGLLDSLAFLLAVVLKLSIEIVIHCYSR